MALRRLPPELARLVRGCVALDDAVALAACALPAFLPTPEELDAYVPESAQRLRNDVRGSPGRASRVRTADAQCSEAGCPYHHESLRWLLLTEDTYAQLARRKLDATEALEHLRDDVAVAQTVTIDILASQARRRQLNRFALARTLECALRHRCDVVVQWILHSEAAGARSLPSSWLIKIALAAIAYDTGVARVALQLARERGKMTRPESAEVLLEAARRGCAPIVIKMLEFTHHDDSQTLQLAIAEAADAGHVNELLLLMRHSQSEVDLSDAVIRACARGRRDVLQELLSASHKIGPRSADSPLLAAASSGDLCVVQLVLSDPRTSQWDPRALQKAAADGSVGVAETLIQHPSCRSKDIVEALRCTLRSKRHPLLPLVQLFFDGLDNREAGDMLAWELVDLACSNGEKDVYDFVMERTRPDKDSRSYWRPLVTAARAGHSSIVRCLLDADSPGPTGSFKPTDDDTETAEALLAASHSDNLPTVQMLFPLVSIELIQLLRVVEAAAAAESFQVLEWLIEQGCGSWCDVDAALHYACAHGRTHAVNVLLARAGARSSDGVALQFAATSGRLDLVELLLQENQVGLPNALEAALVDAAREGHTSVVDRLLSDPRLRITSGDVIHEAAQQGHVDVLQMLLNSPSERLRLDIMDLHLAFVRASQRGHYQIIFILLNDSRLQLPNNGAIRRVSELPRRSGDTMWCRFLRRFFRHPRVDPTADNHQLLVDAVIQGKLGVAEALVQSGRLRMTVSEAEAAVHRLRSVAGHQSRKTTHRLSTFISDLRRRLTS